MRLIDADSLRGKVILSAQLTSEAKATLFHMVEEETTVLSVNVVINNPDGCRVDAEKIVTKEGDDAVD